MAIGEIILHVGMHKTGTTSIQRTFKGYDDGHIAYADLGIPGNMTPNHGPAIETIFRTDFENIPHHRRHGRRRPEIARFRDAFRQRLEAELLRDRDTMIISGEAIPRLRKAELASLRDLLSAHADKVTVLVYVREPQGFCASMFQQICRSGMFLEAGHLALPRYRRKFAKFIRLFGRKNVVFVLYDRASLIAGSSIDDFASRVGIKDIPQVDSANIGLSGDATRLLYLLGMRSDLDFARLESKLALARILPMLQSGIKGDRFRLPAGCVNARVDPKDVAWMEKTTGFDLRARPTGGGRDVDLDHALRQISPDGVAQLRAILMAQGLVVSDDPEEMILCLFRAHLGRSAVKSRVKRAYDRTAGLLGRYLRRPV